MNTRHNKLAMTLMSISTGLLFMQNADARQPPVLADTAVHRPERAMMFAGMEFHPRFRFSQYYDSNIYASDQQENNDRVSSLFTELNLISPGPQPSLHFKAGLEANRYREFSAENTLDRWIGIDTRFDLAASTALFADAAYINDHEDRASPEAIFGIEPTEFNENRVTLGLQQAIGQHSVKLAATAINIDFHDVSTTSSVINNDGRDRSETSTGLRFNFASGAHSSLFLQSTLEQRDYQQPLDANAFDRDSDIQNHLLGIKLRSASVDAELYAGTLQQQFDDSRFDTVSETDFGTRIEWQAGLNSRLDLVVDRSLEETTLMDSSGYLFDQYLLRYGQRLDDHWSCYLTAVQSTADYYAIGRQDDYSDYAIGINYQIEKNLSFGLDMMRMQRDSTEAGDDYDRNQVFLRVSAHL